MKKENDLLKQLQTEILNRQNKLDLENQQLRQAISNMATNTTLNHEHDNIEHLEANTLSYSPMPIQQQKKYKVGNTAEELDGDTKMVSFETNPDRLTNNKTDTVHIAEQMNTDMDITTDSKAETPTVRKKKAGITFRKITSKKSV
jgi:hypothetical protein